MRAFLLHCVRCYDSVKIGTVFVQRLCFYRSRYVAEIAATRPVYAEDGESVDAHELEEEVFSDFVDYSVDEFENVNNGSLIMNA